MNTLIIIRRLLLAVSLPGLVLVACRKDHPHQNPAGTYIAASEKLNIPAGVELPANLPKGNMRVATYYAIGVQQYKSRQKEQSKPAVYEWVFVAPKADLYDVTNRKVGTHGAGPFWTLSSSDSLFAQAFAPPRTAPSSTPGSIDWLLLMPKTGTIPTGIFKDVAYVQRIATKGGLAPAMPPTSNDAFAEVPYEAVYRFSR